MQSDFSSRRQEFRKYLDKSGILDAMTNGIYDMQNNQNLALIQLFELPEKPINPMSFMREFFNVEEASEEADFRKENYELKIKIEHLEKVIEDLKKKLNSPSENFADSAEDGNFVQQPSH